jgi:hypothetical protein
LSTVRATRGSATTLTPAPSLLVVDAVQYRQNVADECGAFSRALSGGLAALTVVSLPVSKGPKCFRMHRCCSRLATYVYLRPCFMEPAPALVSPITEPDLVGETRVLSTRDGSSPRREVFMKKYSKPVAKPVSVNTVLRNFA